MRRGVLFACCAGLLLLGIDPPTLQIGMQAGAPAVCPATDPNPVLGPAVPFEERDAYIAAAAASRTDGSNRAFDAWNAVVARDGITAPVARLRAAETLAGAGRRAEAATVLAQVAADPKLPSTLRV